jgi:uncharacterized protein (DUF697 family)/GTP-binding protein EngB required for normal cell division
MEEKNLSIEEQIKKDEKELQENLKKPNILILGRTGGGKSTIVNDIFGDNTVLAGVGEPVTKGFNKISKPDKDIILFDSEGYEIDETDGVEFLKKSIEFIESKSQHDEDKIHLIWLVVPANSARVTDYELNLFNELQNTNTPVAVLFSKCDETNEEDLNLMIKRFYPDKTFTDCNEKAESPFFTVQNSIEIKENRDRFSKEPIIKWSLEKLPSIFKLAFISSQKVSLDEKKKFAMKITKQHTAGNAITGFTPIPFSDAPVLFASQSAMLVKILKVYGVTGGLVGQITKSTITGTLVSSLGKALVGRLLKFIPVVGTVAGGIINASVASSITYAMGATTSTILYKFINSKVSLDIAFDDDLMSFIDDNFNELFKNYFNKKSKNKI